MDEMKLYRVARRLRWGECDPAGIIYTPAALDIATKILEDWTRDILGHTWFKMNFEMGLGMPTVRAEIDFAAVLLVDREYVCDLHIIKVGGASLTVRITAHDGAGEIFFNVTITSCLVEKPEPHSYKAKRWPDDFRAKIEAYRDGCAGS